MIPGGARHYIGVAPGPATTPPSRTPPPTASPSTGESREERFRRVYDRLFASVYWFCRQRLGPADGAAEDVTADVFTVVWRLIDRVPDPPEDRVFVHAIAYRQIRNHQRRFSSRLRLHHRIASERAHGGPVTDHPVTDHPIADDVRAALARLPDIEREALLLVVVEGFSHGEAAELLGCTANAISLRLRRARAQLRVDLTGARPGSERRGLYLYEGGAQ